MQALVGFRISSAVTAPNGFSTVDGESLVFAQSAEYTSELQRLAPAAAGLQWVGYAATTAVNVTDGSNQHFTVSPQFTLQQGADGAPFTGPFLYRPVVGGRIVSAAQPITRAVACGTTLFVGTTFDAPPADGTPEDGDTICVDAPSESDTATNLEKTTRDLGVLSTAVTGARGRSTDVPFVLRYAGTSTPSANFAIDAATTLPGATATPSQGSLLPATDSVNPIGVKVTIPSSAVAGEYDVTLTARLTNGQMRINTAKLTIPKDTTKPTVTISLVKGQRVSTLIKRGLKLKVKMNEAGKVTLSLSRVNLSTKKRVTIASKVVSYSKSGTKKVVLKLKKRARAAAARAQMFALPRLKLTLKATAKDKAGNKRQVTKRYSLKR